MNDEQLKANAEQRKRRLDFLAKRVGELHREARRQADVEWPAWDREQVTA